MTSVHRWLKTKFNYEGTSARSAFPDTGQSKTLSVLTSSKRASNRGARMDPEMSGALNMRKSLKRRILTLDRGQKMIRTGLGPDSTMTMRMVLGLVGMVPVLAPVSQLDCLISHSKLRDLSTVIACSTNSDVCVRFECIIFVRYRYRGICYGCLGLHEKRVVL